MEDFQIYILQVNAGLVVFYLLYRMLFSRDTFLRIRRLFLFSIVILAFVYPLISLASWLEQGNALSGMVVGYAEMLAVVTPVAPQPAAEQSLFTWQRFLIWIWSGGSLVLTLRMAVQLAGICRFAYQGKKQSCHHVPVIALPKITAPFSFFGWIFVNPAHYEERELHEIIVHESAHARQWHSLDMLLGEILCIFFWFNPVVWLLRKEIRQNLEFLADEQVVNSGYNRKNYQYHLLRLSHQSTAVPIVNNFNVSQLKKRIIMMNKKKTSRIGLLKYAFLLPVTGLLILAGNARAVTDLASHTLIQAGGETSLYKGRVVDEQGNPLQGATVIIKGTSLGASPDQDGEFSIQAGKGDTLYFSYVGKRTAEVICGDKANLKEVVLPKQPVELEGMVVVGYAKAGQNATSKEGEIFTAVEEMPVFKEGNVLAYMARMVKYPVRAQEKGIQGKVIVSFVIDKAGRVTDPQVVRSVDQDLDREALRVVKALPDWIPGKQRGVAVDVFYTLPIEFRLQSDAETPAVSGKADEQV